MTNTFCTIIPYPLLKNKWQAKRMLCPAIMFYQRIGLFYAVDDIQQGAVAVDDVGNDLVTHLYRLRYARNLLCHPFEVCNLNDRQFCLFELLFQLNVLAAFGVDCNSSLGNDHIDRLAGVEMHRHLSTTSGSLARVSGAMMIASFAPAAVSQ